MALLRTVTVPALIGLGSVSCALFGPNYRPAPDGSLAPLPPPPDVAGPLSLSVVYPPSEGRVVRGGQAATAEAESGYELKSRDSTFIFGGAGRGDAAVTVNGVAASVFPSGGWIAWLPLPKDTIARFGIVAVAEGDTARLTLVAPIVRGPPEPEAPPWIDTTSFEPRGERWVRSGESVRLSLRASESATVKGVLPDSTQVLFGTDETAEPRSDGTALYAATIVAPVGAEPALWPVGDTAHVRNDSLEMRVEVVVNGDTARAFWPLRVGELDPNSLPVVTLDDDIENAGDDDGIVVGRPMPGGSYNWFFPNGTLARVSGRSNDWVRLQLSAGSSAWVSASEVQPMSLGTYLPISRVGSLVLEPQATAVVVRIPLESRLPFRVDESERALSLTLYGAQADIDVIDYGSTDSLVSLATFRQRAEDEVVITLSLSRDVWGYRTHWEGNDLLLAVRRPPMISPNVPLSGLVIALDAGHPPLGARGPTGLWEPDAVLDVVRKAAQLVRNFGATPVMIRDSRDPLGLAERVERAERAQADLMVSVHANALPDGVNPFTNNGISVYYFHPRSAALARAVDRALVRQLGYHDLGMLRGEFAVLRGTWMPAILTEGLFMMIPEQEWVLASDEGQWRYARGIVNGVAAFLRERALRAK
ncbi:MAG: N-acetylmuramoyl-L-alanine amidase [Gemmatimonadales bacterium]